MSTDADAEALTSAADDVLRRRLDAASDGVRRRRLDDAADAVVQRRLAGAADRVNLARTVDKAVDARAPRLPPSVTVPAVVRVTEVTAERAVVERVDVAVELAAPPPPEVNVAAPSVTVEVPPQPPPVVNVEAAPVSVTLDADAVVRSLASLAGQLQDALRPLAELLAEVKSGRQPQRLVTTTFHRNADGDLTHTTQEYQE